VHQFQRSDGPRTVQLTLQSIFMGKASPDGGGWVLGSGQYDQHGRALAVGAQAPPSADDAFAVLPHDLETATAVSVELKG
jgi:hypothetical protein